MFNQTVTECLDACLPYVAIHFCERGVVPNKLVFQMMWFVRVDLLAV
jgi:hypothetical protein